MHGWSPRSTHSPRSTLLISLLLTLALSGCSSLSSPASSEPAQLPAVLSEPQSPAAKAYSEKLSDFSKRVADYFSDVPEFTTPQ